MNDIDIKQRDELRKQVLLRIFFSLSLSIHALLIVLFIYLQFYGLVIFTILNFCTFLFDFFLLKKKKYLLAMQLGVMDVVVGSVVLSYLLGWASYFSLYLIASALIIINSFSMKLRWKVFEVVLLFALFVLSLIFTKGGFHVYAVDARILDWIGLFNMLALSFAIFFMEFQNFRENDILKKRLEDMAEIDMLTGAYNRRFFNKYLDIEIKRHTSLMKYGQVREVNFGIAMIDIDNFKQINDTYGHLVGDAVLANVARVIKAALFERDIFCRFGGEEFVVLFTSTSRSGAMTAMKKVVKAVEDYEFRQDEMSPVAHVTVSIGYAHVEEESDIFKLLDLADKRLYAAKNAGKNTVVGV
jgi:diguanylate cyclase (GGDEF)-like protein